MPAEGVRNTKIISKVVMHFFTKTFHVHVSVVVFSIRNGHFVLQYMVILQNLLILYLSYYFKLYLSHYNIAAD